MVPNKPSTPSEYFPQVSPAPLLPRARSSPRLGLTLTIDAARCARYQALIRHHHDDLANSIVLEQGKTHSDAKGDVLRGLQVVDSLCALPGMLLGDKVRMPGFRVRG